MIDLEALRKYGISVPLESELFEPEGRDENADEPRELSDAEAHGYAERFTPCR